MHRREGHVYGGAVFLLVGRDADDAERCWAGGGLDGDGVAEMCAGDAGDAAFDDGDATLVLLFDWRVPAPGRDAVVEHCRLVYRPDLRVLSAEVDVGDEHRLDSRDARVARMRFAAAASKRR